MSLFFTSENFWNQCRFFGLRMNHSITNKNCVFKQWCSIALMNISYIYRCNLCKSFTPLCHSYLDAKASLALGLGCMSGSLFNLSYPLAISCLLLPSLAFSCLLLPSLAFSCFLLPPFASSQSRKSISC